MEAGIVLYLTRFTGDVPSTGLSPGKELQTETAGHLQNTRRDITENWEDCPVTICLIRGNQATCKASLKSSSRVFEFLEFHAADFKPPERDWPQALYLLLS